MDFGSLHLLNYALKQSYNDNNREPSFNTKICSKTFYKWGALYDLCRGSLLFGPNRSRDLMSSNWYEQFSDARLARRLSLGNSSDQSNGFTANYYRLLETTSHNLQSMLIRQVFVVRSSSKSLSVGSDFKNTLSGCLCLKSRIQSSRWLYENQKYSNTEMDC